MYVCFQRQAVEPVGLFLVHDADIYTMKLDGLFGLFQIFNGISPFGIGEEIIIQHLDPFTLRVEFHRLDWMYCTLFVVDEAEWAMTDAATGIELDTELILRIKRVVEAFPSFHIVGQLAFDIVASPPRIISAAL